MNLSAPFIRRPVATMLLSLAIMLLGAVSFGLLPVAPLPKMDFPVIVVSASLPGASPEVMAATVATPLERKLGTIAGVTTLTSSSSQGSTRVILGFDLDRDIDGAAREVQAAINAARNLLPSGMKSMPTYKKINPSQAPIMVLSLTSDVLQKGQLYDLASTILSQSLSQVAGVGEVQIGGSSLPAVRIELQPKMLAQYGLALEDVRETVAAANQGMEPQKAIYQAALLRFRPILMTTLAALFGAVPLMLASGSGAELRQPLGLVMVGGLALSQVLTLFTTPVIYLYFDRLSRRFKPQPAASGEQA